MSKPPSPRFALVAVVAVVLAIGLVPSKALPVPVTVPGANKAVHKSIVIVISYCKDNQFAN